MSFLNPIFLLSLIAVSVPLLIHILSRRRVPEVPFSTLRFLSESDKRSMSRINMRRLLLLVLRMLIVALLALAFARPVVRGRFAALFPARAPRAVCLLIDGSYSMRFNDERGTLFDRAKKRAMEVLRSLDRSDDLYVVLFGDGQRLVYSGGFEPSSAEETVKGLEPTWSGTNLPAAADFARGLLGNSNNEAKELYVISDFQETALGRGADTLNSSSGHVARARREPSGIPNKGEAEGRAKEAQRGSRGGKDTSKPGTTAEKPRGKMRVFFLPIEAVDPSQSAVLNVLTPRVKVHRNEVVRLKISLRNFSRDLAASFPLEVVLGDKRILQREITLPAASSKTEEVEFPVYQTGWIRGVVKKSRDRLDVDDERYFTLDVRRKTNVLLIAGEGSFYLEQALNPEGADGNIALDEKDWGRFSSDDLNGKDVVVIGPSKGVPGDDVDLIEAFAQGGGRVVVMVVPGLLDVAKRLSKDRIEIEYNTTGGFEALAKPLGRVTFLAPFDEEDWQGFLRLKYTKYPMVRGVRPGQIALSYYDGYPFVWIEKHGNGAVVFAAFDPRPESGEIVLSPYFLPLVQQLVLSAGVDTGSKQEHLVGRAILWGGSAGGDVICEMPDGTTVRPEAVEADALLREAAKLGLESGSLSSGGFYRIPPPSSPGYLSVVSGGRKVEEYAVNCETERESDCHHASIEKVASALDVGTYVTTPEGTDIAVTISAARRGKELSGLFVAAALILFVLELIMAQGLREGV